MLDCAAYNPRVIKMWRLRPTGRTPWDGWQGVAHPASMAGGGGPGWFRGLAPLDAGVVAVGLLDLPTTLLGWWDSAKKLGINTANTFEDLARVDWLGNFDTAGLEGDWYALYLIWFFELSPSSVGQWSVEDGVPLVTITSAGYIHDLKGKPNYREALNLFKSTYPNLATVSEGASVTHNFRFTGQGSASGTYNALEWFMGSYSTKITAGSRNSATHRLTVHVEVSNISRWQSGTRMPQSFINRGLPRYLVADAPRSAVGPGGTFKQKFIWDDTIQY